MEELKNLNYRECARYLGYGTTMPDENIQRLMRQCEEKLIRYAKPKFIYRIFSIENTEPGVELLNTRLILKGNSIKAHLEGCHSAVLLCATLSDSVDKLIRKTELKDMAEAVIMDAMASVAVEQVCEHAQEKIKSDYLSKHGQGYFTWRFGFGYGDLPLEQEGMALELLNTAKTVGVNINDSFIMFPRKTVACIIGISQEEIHGTRKGCVSCNMKDHCKFRQRGERCGF